MLINSWKVFRYSYAPYLIAGALIAWGCHYINVVNSQWAEFFIKGISFAILYALVVLLLLNKNDKGLTYDEKARLESVGRTRDYAQAANAAIQVLHDNAKIEDKNETDILENKPVDPVTVTSVEITAYKKGMMTIDYLNMDNSKAKTVSGGENSQDSGN